MLPRASENCWLRIKWTTTSWPFSVAISRVGSQQRGIVQTGTFEFDSGVLLANLGLPNISPCCSTHLALSTPVESRRRRQRGCVKQEVNLEARKIDGESLGPRTQENSSLALATSQAAKDAFFKGGICRPPCGVTRRAVIVFPPPSPSHWGPRRRI